MKEDLGLKNGWRKPAGLGILLLLLGSLTASPATGQGAGLPGGGMGGSLDRLALMKTVVGLRFLAEEPALALDDDQAEVVLGVLKDIARSEALFPLARYDTRTLELLGIETDPTAAGYGGTGSKERWSQVSEAALKSEEALRSLLDREQTAFIEGLDLSSIVGAEVRSSPGAAAPSNASGQPSSVQLLLVELVEILAWQLGL